MNLNDHLKKPLPLVVALVAAGLVVSGVAAHTRLGDDLAARNASKAEGADADGSRGPVSGEVISAPAPLPPDASPTAETPAPQPSAEAEKDPQPLAPVEELTAAAGETRYRIATGSKATFGVAATVGGSAATVEGQTGQVSGDIILNAAEPSKSRMGTVAVDVRGITTNDAALDEIVRRDILRSNVEPNGYVLFVPKKVVGMPAAIVSGEPFDFAVSGDLTISGVTRPATFKAAVQLAPGNRLVGKAVADVRLADFGLTVPQSSFVTGVGDTATITLDVIGVQF